MAGQPATFDLRGVPLNIMEAAVAALQERPTTLAWVRAYEGTDAELLSDIAPAVAASIEAWASYRERAAECDIAGGHDLQVLTDESGPLGVVCGHCSTSWVVEPAPAVPPPPATADTSPGGDGETSGDAGDIGDTEPASRSPEPALTVASVPPVKAPRQRKVAKLRPDPEPEPAPLEKAADAVLCSLCDTPVDPTDDQLAKANAAIGPTSGQTLCGSCLLTCEDCDKPIETPDQAVLSFMRYRKRLDLACHKTRTGARDAGT